MNRILFLLISIIFVNNAFSQVLFNEYTKNWATYFGGQGTRFTNSFVDSNGDIIAVGEITGGINQVLSDEDYYNSFCTSTLPEFMYNTSLASPFSYANQTIIAKFSPSGTLIKSVYLPFYTFVAKIDSNDNIYIGGSTHTNNLATPNAWNETPFPETVNSYGIMAKLNDDFSINWLTYVPSFFIGNFCLDENNNIYGITTTKTMNGITTTNAFQENFIYEITDNNEYYGNGYLFKLNNQGQLQWATYYGLTSGIAVDYMNGELITSFNRSSLTLTQYDTDFYTPNAYSQNPSSQIITKFNATTGERTYSTYLDSGIFRITNDGENYYFYGNGPEITLNGLISPNAYQPNFGGMLDLYLGKFDQNINPIWGTYIGGTDVELIEVYNNITIKDNALYMIGLTTSNFDINSPFPYQNNYAGGNDLLMMKFSLNGDFIWGSFFGGDNLESYGSIVPVSDGTFYIVGNTLSQTNIATADSYQENVSFHPSYPNINFGNGFIAKFARQDDLSVDDFNENSFSIFPNPIYNEVTISGNLKDTYSLTIHNALGQSVYHTKLNNSSSQTIDATNLSSGIYLLIISENNKRFYSKKILKK